MITIALDYRRSRLVRSGLLEGCIHAEFGCTRRSARSSHMTNKHKSAAKGAVAFLSLHPRVHLQDWVENPGFPLEVPKEIATIPLLTDEELRLLQD